MQRSNRDTIAALGSVEVATLPHVGVAVDELAAAGATLPLTPLAEPLVRDGPRPRGTPQPARACPE